MGDTVSDCIVISYNQRTKMFEVRVPGLHKDGEFHDLASARSLAELLHGSLPKAPPIKYFLIEHKEVSLVDLEALPKESGQRGRRRRFW